MFRTSKFKTMPLSSRPEVISVMETGKVTDDDIREFREQIKRRILVDCN
jgi:hypothetical protein